jgi:hypothetical protein
MIGEFTYSAQDLKKRCFNCLFLAKANDFDGLCECPQSRCFGKERCVTDRACVCKLSAHDGGEGKETQDAEWSS